MSVEIGKTYRFHQTEEVQANWDHTNTWEGTLVTVVETEDTMDQVINLSMGMVDVVREDGASGLAFLSELQEVEA